MKVRVCWTDGDRMTVKEDEIYQKWRCFFADVVEDEDAREKGWY